MSGTPSVSQPWPSVNQSQHQKLCRETFSLEENLQASRNPKWGNPRSSFIWRVFNQTTENLSAHFSDVPINKLLEKLLFSDRCLVIIHSAAASLCIYECHLNCLQTLFSPNGSHVSSEFHSPLTRCQETVSVEPFLDLKANRCATAFCSSPIIIHAVHMVQKCIKDAVIQLFTLKDRSSVLRTDRNNSSYRCCASKEARVTFGMFCSKFKGCKKCLIWPARLLQVLINSDY